MVTYLGIRIRVNGWAPELAPGGSSDSCFGVLLRRSKNHYACVPDNIDPVLLGAVQRINVGVAFTMRPEVLNGVLDSLAYDQTDLRLSDGSQMQVLPSLSSLSPVTVRKFQYHCLLRQERAILVWHDDLDQILPHASRLEEKLLSLVSPGARPMKPHLSRSLLGLGSWRSAVQLAVAGSVPASFRLFRCHVGPACPSAREASPGGRQRKPGPARSG